MFPITTRLVTSATDPAVGAFGQLQRLVYEHPEQLIPEGAIRSLLGRKPQGARRDLLLVAEADGELVGGSFFHALGTPLGFSSFMGVHPAHRGRGVARALHTARFAALRAELPELRGVLIDVERPRGEPQAAARVEWLGEHARRAVFAALGFRQLALPYEQPVGGPDGGPLTSLDLLFAPAEAPCDSVPLDEVVASLRAYWTPWLGPKIAERALERLARGQPAAVPLIPPASLR